MADILIIDDDPGMRRVMARALVEAGHQVRKAKNGIDGLALFHSRHSECVIADIVMPEKEGIETIRELRQHAPNVPILAISGANRSAFYLHAATALGANASLQKPFFPAELLGAVESLLNAADLASRQNRHGNPVS